MKHLSDESCLVEVEHSQYPSSDTFLLNASSEKIRTDGRGSGERWPTALEEPSQDAGATSAMHFAKSDVSDVGAVTTSSGVSL